MSSRVLELTKYYSEIQRRSNLVDQVFTAQKPHITVDLTQVREGTLDERSVAQLFTLANSRSRRQPRKSGQRREPVCPRQDAHPIKLIISLITLRQRRSSSGLLLLPASLTPDGTLTADPQNDEPWIPVSRLRTPGMTDREVMVGDLSSLWKWRRGKGAELASNAETWQDTLDLCFNLFSEVSNNFKNLGKVDDTQIITSTCYITPGEVITSNRAILDLYKYLENGAYSAAPVYANLLSRDPQQRLDSDYLDANVDTLKKSAILSTGSMSDEYPLTESQRRAVHAFLCDTSDEPASITAVSGPPGTGKTTLLQSVIASMIVTHAFEDKPAPLIVGTSTNNQAVINIIDSFSKVTKKQPGVLDQRWLPVATEDGATPDALHSLATYCPSQSRMNEAQRHGYLTENLHKSGVYTYYSSPQYIASAASYFVQRFTEYSQAFIASPPPTIKDALEILRKVLVKYETARRELIKERARADSHAVTKLTEFREKKDTLSRELKGYRHHLNSWTRILTGLRQRSTSVDPAEEALVIDMNYKEGEPAPHLRTLGEFVRFYQSSIASSRKLLKRIERRIRKSETAAAKAQKRYKKKIHRCLTELKVFGSLPEKQLQKLTDASDLLNLDQVLDTTVRYAEFWLAVHIYEAEWLLAADGDDLIPERERNRTSPEYMERFWTQVASLTPCFVMTAYQLPKYFRLWTKPGEKSEYDLGRPDLMIVDEAGQVDMSIGAAVFAIPKRALVVGDVLQLSPIWSIDPESDKEMTSVFNLAGQWDDMISRGMTSSQPSSVMSAATTASRWRYSQDAKPGLFLAEHFRCHHDIIQFCNDLLYKGLLKPSRPLGSYKLKDIVEHPFLFKKIANSEDQRKGSSRINCHEAQEIATWIASNFDYFRAIYNSNGDPAKDAEIIGVVTPFAAQEHLIKKALDPRFSKIITVGTAHKLQGAEREIVLFSAVYGNNSDQAVFIDKTLELMNVAVSRAKDLFIVFGSDQRWNGTGPVFRLIRKHATLSDCNFAGSRNNAPVPPAENSTPVQPVVPDFEPVLPPTATPQAKSYEYFTPTQKSSTPESGDVKFVDRRTPGYCIARELLDAWKKEGVLPEGQPVRATQLNQALSKAGLITYAINEWMPTVHGAMMGIALYEGEDKDGRRYRNLIYSPQAQAALTNLVRTHQLVLR